jgi:hypothetical protein
MKIFDQKPSPKIWYIILSMWWAVTKKFSLHFDILLMKSMVFWCWLENVVEIDIYTIILELVVGHTTRLVKEIGSIQTVDLYPMSPRFNHK